MATNTKGTTKNHKGFAIQAINSAKARFQRKEDKYNRKIHIPISQKQFSTQAPTIVTVLGSRKVGKSSIIKNLVHVLAKSKPAEVKGPFTIVTSKKQRMTLFECDDNIFSMVDLAKCTDIAVLVIDASFGFELEIFEFLSICQTHGMPRIIGVLTHLDVIKNPRTLKRQKKLLKHRFWTEVYNGAKLFYLTGFLNGEYIRNEIKNLSRFLAVMKFRPIPWRIVHSYILVDRIEDVTLLESIKQNSKTDRKIFLYGYVKGAPMRMNSIVHVTGYGDTFIEKISSMPDPCPLPDGEKKRLLHKDKNIYSPMSGIGDITFENDLVFLKIQSNNQTDGQEKKYTKTITDHLENNLSNAIKEQDLKLMNNFEVFKKDSKSLFEESNPSTVKQVASTPFQLSSNDERRKQINDSITKFVKNRPTSTHNLMKMIYGKSSDASPFAEEFTINNDTDSITFRFEAKDSDNDCLRQSFLASSWKAEPKTLSGKNRNDSKNKDLPKTLEDESSKDEAKKHWITSDDQFYQQLLSKANNQSKVNSKEFSTLDDENRTHIEGFLPGTYVRIEINNVPYELMDNFNPSVPILIGGLNSCEDNLGFVTAKVKKHRWYKWILKSDDLVTISLGWRRFQTIPVYAKLEDNLRFRFLKYTPTHLGCSMIFFGPIAVQNTGLLIIKQRSDFKNKMEFRVAANGVISGFENTPQIYKKLKMVGVPYKIYENSAFIKNMFSSSLEVAKFEGAKIKTVSGIRGQIKRAVNDMSGSFRATFEDKILLSDIVFCRTWYQIKLPKYYSIITNLLQPEIIEISNLNTPKLEENANNNENTEKKYNTDSIYKPIVRHERQKKQIIVPKHILKAVPYKEKVMNSRKKPKRLQTHPKNAVILSPLERKVQNLIAAVKQTS